MFLGLRDLRVYNKEQECQEFTTIPINTCKDNQLYHQSVTGSGSRVLTIASEVLTSRNYSSFSGKADLFLVPTLFGGSKDLESSVITSKWSVLNLEVVNKSSLCCNV